MEEICHKFRIDLLTIEEWILNYTPLDLRVSDCEIDDKGREFLLAVTNGAFDPINDASFQANVNACIVSQLQYSIDCRVLPQDFLSLNTCKFSLQLPFSIIA